MMKARQIYIVSMLLLIAAGCQRSPLEEKVTLSVTAGMAGMETEDASGAAGTKAVVGDASDVTQLLVGLFDTDGNALYTTFVNRSAGEDFRFTLSLAEGLRYRLVLFAQAPGKYTSGPLDAIPLAPVKVLNDESVDAFYYSGEIVASERQQSVTMSRIFAQLCVATTTAADNNAAMTMTVSSVPTQFNAKTGVFSGAEPMVFEGQSKTNEIVATDYWSLAYAYVPVADNVTLDLSFLRSEAAVSKTVSSVPLRKNYRTNILGNF